MDTPFSRGEAEGGERLLGGSRRRLASDPFRKGEGLRPEEEVAESSDSGSDSLPKSDELLRFFPKARRKVKDFRRFFSFSSSFMLSVDADTDAVCGYGCGCCLWMWMWMRIRIRIRMSIPIQNDAEALSPQGKN